MAGSHRAARPASSSRVSGRAVAVAAVVALLPALWFAGTHLVDGVGSGTTHRPTAAPIPTDPTAVPSPTPTRSSNSTASATPRLPAVAADVPRRLTVTGLLDVGFDDSIEPADGRFPTGSTAEAARWGSRGLPASPGTDTVVLVGKVYRQGASAFDDLPRVKVGDTITLRTDTGLLRYRVGSTGNRAAAGLPAALTAKVPGRLVLIGIRYDAQDDARTSQVLVVTAQLSGATRT